MNTEETFLKEIFKKMGFSLRKDIKDNDEIIVTYQSLKHLYCLGVSSQKAKEEKKWEKLKEELSFINKTTQEIQHKEGECVYCDTLRIIDKLSEEVKDE